MVRIYVSPVVFFAFACAGGGNLYGNGEGILFLLTLKYGPGFILYFNKS